MKAEPGLAIGLRDQIRSAQIEDENEICQLESPKHPVCFGAADKKLGVGQR